MEAFILEHEPTIRLAAFLGVFAAIALWELAAPRRRLATSKARRWLANIGIVAINTALVRLVFASAAVGVAALAAERGTGLFNAIALPAWLEIVLAVVILDFVIYLQHVLFHAVPALWRLHMMHHADLDLDVTSGARFHPVEILLSMVIKIAVVSALGPPVAAVVAFEVVLNATAMFNHGNLRLPEGVDRVLRLLVVTPDMHRVHHSAVAAETNSNFGFNLPWWDRLLGTYRAQPAAGHEGMTLGLAQFRDPERLTLAHILVLPWRGETGEYPLGRRARPGPDAAPRP
jgi:sterol desaturase/sphingolipid hydroxylase (fatty acid hydroxylase superfamily)